MFDMVELVEVVGKAAGADVVLASDAELCTAAVGLARVRAGLDAAEAHVLGELEARGVCDREFGLSTASWLAERTRGSRPVLAGRVNTAVKLRRLEVIDSAWCAGVITSDHVRVVVDAANPRVFDQFVALQAGLVDAAAKEPFVAWKRDVAGLAELLDADGGYDPSKDLCRNHLHVRPLGADGVVVSGELFGEHATSFTTLLAAPPTGCGAATTATPRPATSSPPHRGPRWGRWRWSTPWAAAPPPTPPPPAARSSMSRW